MAYIKINETNRITAASYYYHCGDGEIEVDIPAGIELEHIHEYLYVNGSFVHDPLPMIDPKMVPTWQDKIEAQVTYNSMMLGTLIEEV